MERDDILRNAETFEISARESMQESNRQIFTFADLLIKIAFAIAGLASTFLVSSDQELLYVRWGIVFVSLSIVFGGSQMLLDSRYFREHGRKLIDAADRWKFWAMEKENEVAYVDAKKSLDNLASLKKTSSLIPLVLQITFVVLGTIFVLIEVFSA